MAATAVRTLRPIERGKQRAEFVLSAQSAEYNRVLDLHHTQEVYARQRARIMRSMLRTNGQRDLAFNTPWVRSMAQMLGVAKDHQDLFVSILQRTINKDIRR